MFMPSCMRFTHENWGFFRPSLMVCGCTGEIRWLFGNVFGLARACQGKEAHRNSQGSHGWTDHRRQATSSPCRILQNACYCLIVIVHGKRSAKKQFQWIGKHEAFTDPPNSIIERLLSGEPSARSGQFAPYMDLMKAGIRHGCLLNVRPSHHVPHQHQAPH